MTTDPRVTLVMTANPTPALEQITLACPVCRDYFTRRGAGIFLAVAIKAEHTGLNAADLLAHYRIAVHVFHRYGGCLSIRTRTKPLATGPQDETLFIKRTCNGCNSNLGDIRPAELDAAALGGPVPDVRLECGCLGREDVPA